MQNKELILGIDDAGRGPIIGPMILAGCLVTKELEKEFKESGVDDSKLLTPTKREALAIEIRKKAIAFEIAISDAEEIDDILNSKELNLNELEAIKAAKIINKLTKDREEKINIVIDCPSVNTSSWKESVIKYLDSTENISLSCEHKADQNHPSVSAASILAKSTRESEIAKIRKEIGKDFGSGYPNDPKTKQFLRDFGKQYENSGIFRKTWQTWKNLYPHKSQKPLTDY